MATRGRIGIKRKDGTIISAYQHWDSYLSGLGYNLCENWTDSKKVLKAIQLGNASKWGVVVGEKHDFDADRHGDGFEHMNCYYMRDRGERDQGPRIFKDEAEYLQDGFRSGEEYVYLMKDVGEKDFLGKPCMTWFYAHYSNPTEFSPVEEVAIKEHIESLQRYLKDKRERKVA